MEYKIRNYIVIILFIRYTQGETVLGREKNQ